MRMADDRGVCSIGISGVEQGFQATGWAIQKQ
jgi:hypothetical protein